MGSYISSFLTLLSKVYFEMDGNCYLILLHPQVHKLLPLELKESLHQLFPG